jgi:Ca2+-binding RTX toxin-like protein
LDGGDGHDILADRFGADQLYGGNGPDVLEGGTGTDRMEGGNGHDTFIFLGTTTSSRISRTTLIRSGVSPI